MSAVADQVRNLDQSFAEFDALAGESSKKTSWLPVMNQPANILTLSEFLAVDIPPRDMLLSPWLQSQSLCMLYSWRGVSKTHAALNSAYAVACGGAFLNWSATIPRKVFYLDGEMPAAALQARLAGIVASFDPTPPDGYFKLLTPDMQVDGITPNLASIEGQDAITRAVEDDTALVVVDNLSCLVRSAERENDAESWQSVSTWALKMRARGHSVLFVHHAGKAGAQRGTSKREDLLDTVLCLKRPEDYEAVEGARFEIHYEKARGLHGDDVQPIEAKLVTDADGRQAWTWRPVEDATSRRLVSLIDEGTSQKDCADELGLSRFAVGRLRKRAHAEGLVELRHSRDQGES